MLLLKVDLDVQFSKGGGKVRDDYKIRMILPMVHHLLDQGCTLGILTHEGCGLAEKSGQVFSQRLSALLEPIGKAG